MDLILLSAIADGQVTSECSFTIAIDGGPPTPADTSIPGPATAQIPPGAQQIQIQATPTSPNHWPLTGLFQHQGSGQLISTGNTPAEFAPPRGVSDGTDGIILVTVYLSRVQDATQDALTTLAGPFPPHHDPPAQWPPATVNQPAGNWPPTFWNSPEQDDLFYIGNPAVSGNAIQVQQLSLAPDVEDVVLRVQNVSAPQTIAVSWPNAVPRTDSAGPTPFLVYFHPTAAQNKRNGEYVQGIYPFSWDYVFFGLWRYMNYVADPLIGNPFAKGLPYQMAASGKNAVIVLPCNNGGDPNNVNSGGPEVGVLRNAASMERILLEIQEFMFRRAGVYATPGLGRTALASFSDGNVLVTNFLERPDNRSHPFYLDTLRELYMFDAPANRAPHWVDLAIQWAKLGSSTDKMIRAYTRGSIPNYASLLGQPVPSTGPFIITNQFRTAAVLPTGAWNSAASANGNSAIASGPEAWQDAHQLISAMMLTDALLSSGF